MSRLVLVSGMLLGLALCSGCGPKVAGPGEFEIQGDDAAKQMEYMEAQGNEAVNQDPTGGGPAQ